MINSFPSGLPHTSLTLRLPHNTQPVRLQKAVPHQHHPIISLRVTSTGRPHTAGDPSQLCSAPDSRCCHNSLVKPRLINPVISERGQRERCPACIVRVQFTEDPGPTQPNWLNFLSTKQNRLCGFTRIEFLSGQSRQTACSTSVRP